MSTERPSGAFRTEHVAAYKLTDNRGYLWISTKTDEWLEQLSMQDYWAVMARRLRAHGIACHSGDAWRAFAAE
jgi:hypothetical protein